MDRACYIVQLIYGALISRPLEEKQKLVGNDAIVDLCLNMGNSLCYSVCFGSQTYLILLQTVNKSGGFAGLLAPEVFHVRLVESSLR